MPAGEPNSSCSFGGTTFDVTRLAQAWLRTGRPDTKQNFGVLLRAPWGDGATFESLFSGETIGAPRLDVTYVTVPDATATAPSDQATVGTDSPSLQVSAPRSNPNLQCLFRIANGSDAESDVIVAQSGWKSCDSGASWKVPQNLSRMGKPISGIRGRVTRRTRGDGHGPVGASLQRNRRFGSGGPSPTDAAGSVTVNLATGNVVYQASSPSFPTVAGSLGVSFTYNSLRPVQHGLNVNFWNDATSSTHLTGTPVLTKTDPVVITATARSPRRRTGRSTGIFLGPVDRLSDRPGYDDLHVGGTRMTGSGSSSTRSPAEDLTTAVG